MIRRSGHRFADQDHAAKDNQSEIDSIWSDLAPRGLLTGLTG
jgi:hypothetical protein